MADHGSEAAVSGSNSISRKVTPELLCNTVQSYSVRDLYHRDKKGSVKIHGDNIKISIHISDLIKGEKKFSKILQRFSLLLQLFLRRHFAHVFSALVYILTKYIFTFQFFVLLYSLV